MLDLFAGSGQLGIESLSRGARKAVFVDSNAQSVALTNKNLLACGFENLATVKLADFKAFLTTNNEKFDIIFLDPPYHLNLWGTALSLIEGSIAPRGIIALEHPIEYPIENLDGYFRKDYKYGKIIVGNVTQEFSDMLLGMSKPTDIEIYNKMTPFFNVFLDDSFQSCHYGTEIYREERQK